ncbi:hypothetical protein NDU88_003617 [Pleurodeles waltl]|uniref:Uncharacterized protein n=1 Tax=Pleurodeles waltl TaxID=8319 RepID=A0AAV7LSI8_PLEWA|nr:hypothetical protein NDU88_003617 [Pleurodeles waltl]
MQAGLDGLSESSEPRKNVYGQRIPDDGSNQPSQLTGPSQREAPASVGLQRSGCAEQKCCAPPEILIHLKNPSTVFFRSENSKEKLLSPLKQRQFLRKSQKLQLRQNTLNFTHPKTQQMNTKGSPSYLLREHNGDRVVEYTLSKQQCVEVRINM